MDIFIHTQYCENYGSDEMPYWKFKGGDTYVVADADLPMTDRIGAVAQAIVDAVKPELEYKNDYSSAYVIDWEIVASGTLTQWEQDQLDFDGKITDPSKRIVLAERAA